ncbi:tldc domain-containing protein [Stylonychia lemnae]|uniref:Tldc domain-containing protein n=1 Tax=Stylonychia lemnae TaxID=5949 RepID=A0A078A1V9_STYLE|nr:tldc domain-containing protein [Stylonychia lemnae]|eukprot:CDW75453.1 tldc domain-containing protein [Stylonychia lemnae]
MILSCGHTICNQCIEFQISNEGTFKRCLQDDSCMLDEDSKITPVKDLINNLDKISNVNITCDKHPQKLIKTYCKKTNQLLCSTCLLTCPCNNANPEKSKVDLSFFDCIKQQNNQSLQKENILSLQNFKILQIIKPVEQIIQQKQQQTTQQDEKQIQETLQKLQDQYRPKYIEFRRLVDYHLESLKQQETKDKPKLLPLIVKQCKLLFKATNDGFLAANFHQKCDNQGPTISFILSENGQVFGCQHTIKLECILCSSLLDICQW